MIPKFWEECKKDGTIEKLHELGGSCTIMGIGENVYNDGFFKYMIGVEMDHVNAVSGARNTLFQIKVIPKSTWVVFEPVLSKPRNVIPVWEYITKDFLPNCKYKMADTPDLEVNTKIDEAKYNCEIWIPVIEKQNE